MTPGGNERIGRVTTTSNEAENIFMKTNRILVGMALLTLCAWGAVGADKTPVGERRFQENMDSLLKERDAGRRARQAHEMVTTHWYSSQQVKAIALKLQDDEARLQFATAAYAHTVDPENFYEVYDAFTTFSKVMRLHDRIHRPDLPPGPVVVVPQTVTDDEMKEYLAALRKESFDHTRTTIARQIIRDCRKPFLAAQVKAMLDCFDFEPPKLELAKYAYDFTFDQDKYFQVSEGLAFINSKQDLARYIEGKRPRPPRNDRH